MRHLSCGAQPSNYMPRTSEITRTMPVRPNGLSDMVLSTPPRSNARSASHNGSLDTMTAFPDRHWKERRTRKDKNKNKAPASTCLVMNMHLRARGPMESCGMRRRSSTITTTTGRVPLEDDGIILPILTTLPLLAARARRRRRKMARRTDGRGRRMPTPSRRSRVGRRVRGRRARHLCTQRPRRQNTLRQPKEGYMRVVPLPTRETQRGRRLRTIISSVTSFKLCFTNVYLSSISILG